MYGHAVGALRINKKSPNRRTRRRRAQGGRKEEAKVLGRTIPSPISSSSLSLPAKEKEKKVPPLFSRPYSSVVVVLLLLLSSPHQPGSHLRRDARITGDDRRAAPSPGGQKRRGVGAHGWGGECRRRTIRTTSVPDSPR